MLLSFFFNDTATTEIYTLSLHGRSSDLALPAQQTLIAAPDTVARLELRDPGTDLNHGAREVAADNVRRGDRKSTRLNSSHSQISYAVFCLKKKNTNKKRLCTRRSS